MTTGSRSPSWDAGRSQPGIGDGSRSEAILYEAAFFQAPIAMAITDARGRYVRVNRAMSDLLAQDEEALLGSSFHTGVHPDDLPAELAQLQRLVNLDVSSYELQNRRLHPQRGVIWIRQRVSLALDHHGAPLIPDERGAPAYVIRQVVDITAEREWQKAVEESHHAAVRANQAKNEFLSRMSHELRTPLNAVLGFAQLLELDDLAADHQESVDHILKAGRHLLDLIEEVLDISRIEAGRLNLSPEPVHLGSLLTDAVALVRPLADNSGIHLLAPTGEVCQGYVLADRQRLKQVLLNLLTNGVKYNRLRGTVAVSCASAEAGRIRIDVTDTGPGIHADQIPLLFTPFERLGAEQTGIEGSGIGLALSRRLTEAMGGSLDVTTTLGQGSTFHIELPGAEGPVERYERLNGGSAETPAAPASPRLATILHIEDNLANVALVERILSRRSEIRLVAAMQGGLGLELAREHRPVLILLDLHLPDMGGDEVLRRLRQDAVTASIPVVMVSADATRGQVERLLAAGAAAYLTKPLDVRELLRLVDQALADAKT